MFNPLVRPSFGSSDELLPSAQADAVARGMKWLHTVSGLLVTPASEVISRVLLGGTGMLTNGWPAAVLDMPVLVAPSTTMTPQTTVGEYQPPSNAPSYCE